jgi:hypothetical protein
VQVREKAIRFIEDTAQGMVVLALVELRARMVCLSSAWPAMVEKQGLVQYFEGYDTKYILFDLKATIAVA